MQRNVFFDSDGLRLAGVLHVPDDMKPGEQRAAIAVLHGFGGTKNGGVPPSVAAILEGLGYVVLRFDMRGCGDSEGARGRVICLEQVQDSRHAVTFLQSCPEVLPHAVGLLGFSFGAAVAVYTAGVDPRVAACVSAGGWGHGEKKFQKQHASPEAWKKFTDMLERGRAELARGVSIDVPRFDIVPIRPGMRNHLADGAFMSFPFEVVESMYGFRANDVVAQIAPRPLLLMHPANDTVTPTDQSLELFQLAGQPTELHLFAEVDHFMLAENNAIVQGVLSNWLNKYHPLGGKSQANSNA